MSKKQLTCSKRQTPKRKNLCTLSMISSFLVAALVTAYLPFGLTAVGAVAGIDMGNGQAFAAQVSSPNNISTITDTSSDAARQRTFTAADIKNNMSLMWVNGTDIRWDSSTDPTGNQYLQLVGDGSQQFGYGVFKKQLSATADFKVNGFLNPTNLSSNGSGNSGDWVGVGIVPTDPNQFIVKSDGGAIGIANTANALALGIDMYRNNNYNDPSDGPFGALRWTDSGGTIQGFGSMNQLYTSSQDLTQWGKQISYEFYYHYNNGTPYVTGSLIEYGNGNHAFSFDTRNPGGGTPLNITVPPSGFYTIFLNAANGSNHQAMRANATVTTGQLYASTVSVFYREEANQNTDVAPSTSFKSATRDIIGITNFSSGAKAGTDDWTYDGSVPATAGAKYKTGWHLSRTVAWNNNAQDITVITDASKNTYTLFYAPDTQQAQVKTDATDPTGAQSVETISGVSGGTMGGWTKKDADLTRAGYTYTVTGPNNVKYSSLSAAQAAVSTYDSTSNGTATTDSAPQVFTVTYTKAFQQAQVKTVLNGTTTTKASYDNTPSSTPDRPLGEGTGGNTLKAEVNDAALAKPGYTYTVTGPNGTNYATMQAAWAANNTWDTTANPPGSTSDSVPQVWTVNYTGKTQTTTLQTSSVVSTGPAGVPGTLETVTGPSDSKITFTTTDDNLKKDGYTYVVKVYDGSGTQVGGNYTTLANALAANPNYDATDYTGSEDTAKQKFEVVYTPLNATVTYNYISDTGTTLKDPTTNSQAVGATIDTTNHPDIAGYTYVQVKPAPDSDADGKVNVDGTSKIVYVYTISQSIKDAAQSAITNANNSPVKNEQSVQDATSNLQNVLNNPASTPQQIQDATNALNNTVSNETTARNTAVDNANQAIADADNSLAKNDPNVVDKENTLKNILNDPASTTDQIKQATDALNQARTQAESDRAAAINAANTALAATSPVSNEQAVSTEINNLHQVLNDPASTNQQITDATNALSAATTAAKTDRDSANTAANNKITEAQASTSKNEPSVQQAITNLQKIQSAAATDSSTALTADIVAATQAITDAMTAASTKQGDARNAATTALDPANTSPVTNEPAVAQAKNNLQTLLSDPNSTAQQITDATNALNSAVAAAKNQRQTAVNNANTTITAAQGNANDNADANVQTAITNLQNVMNQAAADDPANLTQQIIDATNALNEARSSVDAAKAAAINDANNALNKTAPVSDEPAVVSAKNSLQTVLDNPDSTTQQITDATQALTDAVATAKTERDSANDSANSAISSAQGSNVISEQSVKDAISALQSAQSQAAADNNTVNTQDIINATNALNQAVADAKATDDAARGAAQQAIADASPVTHEDPVKGLISQLNSALADPNTTTEQIKALTDALNQATADKKADREDAKNVANDQISAIPPELASETSVVAAKDALNAAIAAADADADDNATTANIDAARQALADAIASAQTARQTAVDNANTATKAATDSPVNNEQNVIDKQSALDDLLNNQGSTTTAAIEQATQDLNNAVTAAQSARDTARSDAQTAIDNAKASNVKNEPGVTNAETKLQNLLNDPTATTDQIKQATNDLNQAVTDAQTERQTAVDNANQAKNNADTSAVSNETAVSDAKNNLDSVLSNPDATTQQITDATQALQDAVNNATSERQEADTRADAAKNQDMSPVSHEPSVKDALNNLNNATTTQEKQAATDALNKAVADAKQARQDAVTAANNQDSQTKASPVAQEPGVVAAEQALQTALDKAAADATDDGTTDNIKQATAALESAKNTAQTAQDNANSAINDANNSSVKNEQSVKDKVADLQNALNDPTTSAADLQSKTDALNQAVADAETSRQSAVDNANQAIGSAQSSPGKDDPAVIDDIGKLQDALNDPEATTDAITNATTDLNNAVTAAPARQASVTAAKEAMKPENTSPVTNEPATIQAKEILQATLENSSASSTDIDNATAEFNTALAAAKEARSSKVAEAESASAQAKTNQYASTPAVANAIANLDNTITKSKADDPSALNSDLQKAMDDLQLAIDRAPNVELTEAAEAAKAAMNASNTKPVSNEPGTIAAKQTLSDVVDNPSATAADLKSATDTFNNALATEKAKRAEQITAAQNALANAQASGKANTSVVADATAKLQDIINRASNDDPTALDANIAEAISELNDAVQYAIDNNLDNGGSTDTIQGGSGSNSAGGSVAAQLPKLSKVGDFTWVYIVINLGFIILGLVLVVIAYRSSRKNRNF